MYKGSEESARKALAVYEAVVVEQPKNRDYYLSVAETALSSALSRQGNPHEALPHARRGVSFAEAMAASDPANVSLKRVQMLSYSHLADVLGSPTSPSMGDTAAAISVYRNMLRLAEQMASADSLDQRAAFDQAMTLYRLGSALLETASVKEGLEYLRRSTERMRAVAAAEPENTRVRVFVSSSLKRLGDGLAGQGSHRAAVESYRAAIREAEAVAGSESAVVGMLAGAYSAAGVSLAKLGRGNEALEAGRHGVDLCEKTRRSQPDNNRASLECAAAHASLGRIRSAAGDRASACAEFASSLATYQSAGNNSGFSPRYRADLEQVRSEAGECPAEFGRR
jgi:tetratricopeptide (TPR) repeat protein